MKSREIFYIEKDTLMGETWKPLMGFEGRYMISSFGRLLSYYGKFNRLCSLMSPCVDIRGYYATTLRNYNWITKEKKFSRVRIHVLVAEHFLIKPNIKKPVVNHLDGNKLNNAVTNLEWTTTGENIRHAVRIGLIDCKGEKHVFHKLTESDVKMCRIMYFKGHRSQQQLANIFGISRRNMGDVVNGVTWAWLKDGLKSNKQLELAI